MQTESANTPEPAAPTNLVHLSIPTPAGDAKNEATKALTYAQGVTISTAEDSVIAQEARASINTRIKTLTDARMALTRPIDVAKKVIMDFFGGPIGVLEQAKGLLDGKVLTFDTDQENIRKEAQRKAEADAQRKRDQLQAEANERQRKADEEAQRLRDEAAAMDTAGDSAGALKLAMKADKVVEKAAERAEVLQDRAAQVVAPIFQSQSVKASGSSFRDNWKWRLIDMDLVKDGFKKTVTNDVAIDAIVKSMKGNAEAIHAVVGAGIEIYNDRGIASRRA